MASGGGGGGGSGYSASQSTSESNTMGLNVKFGPFQNGGGVRIPEYFWPVVAGVLGLGLITWLILKFKSK